MQNHALRRAYGEKGFGAQDLKFACESGCHMGCNLGVTVE